ncbi:MAG: hypothetical protein ACRD2D_13230 [Terriglobales bacterium]
MPRLAAAFLSVAAVASVAWARPQAPAIPPGTKIKLVLLTKLDTGKVQTGDKITARLDQDLKIHGQLVAAKNSEMLGLVTEVDPAQGSQPAKLGILFNQLVPKQGSPITVRAAIAKVSGNSAPGSIMMSPELCGSNMTFNNNPAYAHMDHSSDGIPIQYALMETYNGSGTDLGGIIQSVGRNFVLDKDVRVEVQFLHN